MSTPIKREDIRKGDKVREIREYTATCDQFVEAYPGNTYELINRPAELPTEYGLYQISNGMVLDLSIMGWRSPNLMHYMETEASQSESFTLLRPVAEVAAEVIADVRKVIPATMQHPSMQAVISKWVAE
ncbi:hypothetical protein [Cryobacterium sp. GrIS_2_6]|uniref:hypothetical protein n=1 Tax=Cryobacterium sp. GrIS_2_6 TaxID=3162785 RepID=UPI002DFF0957|nr:hypothetical protein [Cryobacterium psychrotolerans]MEC5149272.1 hypothetical protein [Cryobacterium psychrotolerans]MEC5149351.1 hypothetical protein [Cryobacterium psychrotolerans]